MNLLLVSPSLMAAESNSGNGGIGVLIAIAILVAWWCKK